MGSYAEPREHSITMSFHFLDKGKNYKVTPSNKSMTETLEINTERLACGLRYANPFFTASWNSNNTTNPKNHPLHDVTKTFKKVDLLPPPVATYSIESKIKKLKAASHSWINYTKTAKINNNVKKSEMAALKDLKNQENLTIQLSDKTSKICIIEKNLADKKLLDHVQSKMFTQVPEDPSPRIEKAWNKLVDRIFEDPSIDIPVTCFKKLKAQNSQAPLLRTLQKDHKDGYPDCKIRPVQPILNSAVYKADYLVSKVLGQILPHLQFRIPNTKTFIDRITSLDNNFSGQSFQASLDVANMFPTIPISGKAINVIHDYIVKYRSHIELYGFKVWHIMEILAFSLSHTYIKAGENYYLQDSGVGTGSSVSPSYSEIIIDYTYTQALIITDDPPNGLSLYMDDCWLEWIGDLNSFLKFKDNLNSIWPNEMVFTHEIEEDGKINFLDVTVSLY